MKFFAKLRMKDKEGDIMDKWVGVWVRVCAGLGTYAAL